MKKLIILAFISSSCFAADPQQSEFQPLDAEQYDKNSKPQFEKSLKHLEKHKESIANAQLIVELGCNTANIGRYLAEHNPETTIVGIDPNQGAISYADHKHAGLKNLRLICAPAQTFNLQEDNLPPADLIACYHVLHWIKKDQLPQVFENITANLAPGGILDLCTAAKQEKRGVEKAITWTIVKPIWWLSATRKFLGEILFGGTKKNTPLTAQELKQYALDAGLQVDTCEEYDMSCSFDTRDEFGSWLHTLLKAYGIDKMEQEHQRPFINDIVQCYCDHYNPEEATQNGKIEYRFTELLLVARKLTKEIVDSEQKEIV